MNQTQIKKNIEAELCELAKGLDEEKCRNDERAERLIELASKVTELEWVYARNIAHMQRCLAVETERRKSLERLLSGGTDTTRNHDTEGLEAQLTNASKIRQRMIDKIVRMSKR